MNSPEEEDLVFLGRLRDAAEICGKYPDFSIIGTLLNEAAGKLEQLKGLQVRLEAVELAAARLARNSHPEDVYTSGLSHALHELDAFKYGVKP